LRIPSDLKQTIREWFGTEGERWIATLPDIVDRLAEEWNLEIGSPFAGGSVSLVLAVFQVHGKPAVLKIPCLDDESRAEPDALRHYAGAGVVELYRYDSETGAMLLERVHPGTPLAAHPDPNQALDIACGLLRRIWKPAAPGHRFPLVRDVATQWANSLQAHLRQGGSLPRDLVNHAAELARALANGDGHDEVVVNRDGHLGNILAAEREPWLLIDPKPLVGEPAFDAGYLVLDRLGDSPTPEETTELVDRIAAGLGVERERVRQWALVRAVENALWSLTVGASPQGYLTAATALIP
jgi:streptomycin 6-kinase